MRLHGREPSRAVGAARAWVWRAMLTAACVLGGAPVIASDFEPPAPGVESASWLNDDELAGRLAGFLWRAAPDEALRATAARRQLHRPEILRGQAARLMADARSREFVKRCLAHWLDFQEASPQASAAREGQDFFAWMLRENRSVRALLDPGAPARLRQRVASKAPGAAAGPHAAERLARSLAPSLVEQARGAPLRDADTLAVDDIVARSKVDGYRLGTLIHEVIQSELFQTK